ncbi:efflux RND transporter periplasmic adaptor subunit [Parahaliea maris]|uniref:Efflux RND transporter periplasmic adaptor subunit n=1 Tax=Parahaliea maris TaxID=2716870 RepID=A0A5C9A2U5_9GAMM|nr:efflux RND transporter periplasmic adaptor subunit [Parahaliea maris]TXS95195.1 efflux RND transporter periplasmic adaptor subunit [Parahaliea maris]
MTRPLLQLTTLLLATACAAGVTAQDEALDCVINPNSTVELGSHQDGVLEAVLARRGDIVTRGQALAVLDSEMEAMNAELARVRAESDTALRSSQVQAGYRDREWKRLESLRDNQSVSASLYEEADIEHQLARLAVETAKLERSIAQAEYDRARAQLTRRTIKSPVDGIVVDVVMSPGEYVHEQSTLMRLAATDPLFVEVYVPVASYGRITKGDRAIVRPEAPIGGEYRAEVTVVDQVFDAASRTFGIRLELPNQDFALPGGVRCTVEFSDGLETAASVPQ